MIKVSTSAGFCLALFLLCGCHNGRFRLASLEQAKCSRPVPIPKGVPKNASQADVNNLEIRVELAREAERKRGDACASALNWSLSDIDKKR